MRVFSFKVNLPRNNIYINIMVEIFNYSNTIIYKIVCNDLTITEIYVGSTINFKKRTSVHKTLCINKKNRKLYNIINENGGWDNWTMLEIENFSCSNSEEAREREMVIYDQLNATLNSCKPRITTKKSIYQKQWYELNKDKMKQWYDNRKILKRDQN